MDPLQEQCVDQGRLRVWVMSTGVDASATPLWQVEVNCHSAAFLAERFPDSRSLTHWAPGCGPGALIYGPGDQLLMLLLKHPSCC